MDGVKLKHIYVPENTHDILTHVKYKKFNGAELPYVAMRLIEAGAKKICPEYFKVSNNETPTQKWRTWKKPFLEMCEVHAAAARKVKKVE